MGKILESWKLEVLLLFRNIYFWIISLIFIIFIGVMFYTELFKYHNPGGALTISAYVVQAGILFFMIFAFYSVRLESKSLCEDTFFCISSGHFYKIMGKLLLLLTTIILFTIISVVELWFFYWKYRVSDLFYIKSVEYIIMYWTLPFLVSGLIGLIVGIHLYSRTTYILFLFIWLFISPLNSGIIGVLSTMIGTDLSDVAAFLNLGQTNPYAPFDPVYGFPMEIHRWLQKGIWIICVLFLFFIVIIQKNFKKKLYFVFISVMFLGALLTPFIYGLSQEEQFIKTGYEKDSVVLYDYNYYLKNPVPNFQNSNPFMIESYEIYLKVSRNMKLQVNMEIRPLLETQKISFTLYHDLKIKSVTCNNRNLHFNQKGDQVEITFLTALKSNYTTILTVEYEGTSSPYFYANEQAVLLPSFFPWLPYPGTHQCMSINDGNLTICPLYPRKEIKYTLYYSGPNSMYTNLVRQSDSIWNGKASNGVTIVSGMMGEKKFDDVVIYYPLMLNKVIDKVPEYLKKIRNQYGRLHDDLNVHIPNFSKIFLMSIPDENSLSSSNIWGLDDNFIIGINQTYGSGEIFDREVPIRRLLESSIRNIKTFNQSEEIKTLFLFSYQDWYNLKNTLKNDKLLFSEKKLKHEKKSYHSTDEKYRMELEKIACEKLASFIKRNENNPALVNTLFIKWLNQLNSDQKMAWQDIIKIIEELE